MLKGIVEKALGSLLVVGIVGLSTLMYKEFETYNEIRNLLEVKHELEAGFIKEVKNRKRNDSIIVNKINSLTKTYKKDSTDLKYCKEWVNYWVSIR